MAEEALVGWASVRCDAWWFVVELRYFDGGFAWGRLRGWLPGEALAARRGSPGGPRAPAAALAAVGCLS